MNTPQTPIMQTWQTPTPQTAIMQSRRSDPTGGQKWLQWMIIAPVIVSFFSNVTSRCESTEPRIQSAAVFSCQFQRAQDKNADKQPDAWRRRRDREHPSFVQSEITPRDPLAFRKAKETEATLAKVYHAFETGVWDPNYVPEITPPQLSSLMDSSVLNDCYKVRLDGGAFEIVSPRFDIDTRFDYVLEAEIETQKLAQHSASVEIRLVNSQGEVFASHSTKSVTGTSDWNLLTTPNINTDQEGRIRAEVCIRVQPLSKKFGRGVARFDNIQLIRKPTLTIKTDTANNIATPGSTVEFSCSAAGLAEESTGVHLEIRDIDGNVFKKETKPLSGGENSTGSTAFVTRDANRPNAQVGKAVVTFPVKFEQPGLYEVTASLGSSRRQILVAIMTQAPVRKGPFGISLESIPSRSQSAEITRLIQLASISWVKLPIWYDSEDTDKGQVAASFTKELKRIGISTVGRLDGPPASQYDRFDEDPSKTQSISHFGDSRIWEPLLDPILSELNTSIDYLQLGSDTDTGFADSPNAAPVLEKIRAVLQYYFQEPKLVVASDWLSPRQKSDADSQYFHAIHYSTQPQLTASELSKYASAISGHRAKRWATVDSLSKSNYPLEDRVVELLEKLIAVNKNGIQAAFITSPFNVETGLFDEQLTPGEMLVPWAHAAAAIGSRQSIGSIDLPKKSQNVTYQGEDGDVMFIWNSKPVVEELFFGDEATAIDIWGRAVKFQVVDLANGGKAQRIQIGKWPIIIQGVDSSIIRWRQEFQVLADHLNSHLSGENTLPVQLQNTFSKRAKGTLILRSPSLLKGGERPTTLDLETGHSKKIAIPIEFRSDASAGMHQLEFQFQLRADKDYSFSVHRNLRLGHPDIDIRWDLIRVSDELVEAKVELTNKTNKSVDFDCTVFPPNQPYLRISLSGCSPGTTTKVQNLPIPKTSEVKVPPIWIRCTQIRSPLTLNYLVEEQQGTPR